MTHFSVDEILNLPDNKKRETLETLLAELKSLKGKDKYGLYWDLNATTEGEETVIKECQTFFPVLDAINDENGLKHLTQFAPPQSDLFDNPDKPQPTHLLIEGDNYHALNALLYTHRKAVDLIYIDPPYNTGNKDFRYNDNFIDKENGGRHTLWLSFMKTRLEMARELLKDTGVIFISIDDNEQAQLKLLCDRVFGEGNFKNNIAVRRGSKNVQSQFETVDSLATGHEYILVYTKSSTFRFPKLEKNLYSKKDGKWDTFWRGTDRHTMRYELFGNHPSSGQWRWEKERAYRAIENYQNYLEKHSDTIAIDDFHQEHLAATNEKLDFLRINEEGSIQYYVSSKETKLVSDNWMDISLGGSFANFQTEKNVELMKRIVEWITSTTPSVILDFFAGSGTTGHAVLELNKQDGGRRQFILVTNNEVTDKTQAQLRKEGKTEAEIEALGICRSVTYPRLQKVIEGYTTPKGEQVLGTGGRLRYYRTEYVERSPNFDQQAYNFKGKCTEMLCIKENVFTPLADSNDKPYDAEGWEVYRDYDKTLAVLHDDTPQFRADLKAVLAQQTGHTVLYIFGLGSGISLDEYNNYFEKGVRIEPMPSEIMNLYKRKFDRKKK